MTTPDPSPGVTTGANAPVAGLPVQVYFPAAVGTPHATLFNNGATSVYIGGSGVTSSLGFRLKPGDQLSLPNAPYPIWAAAGYSLGTVTTTLTTNAVAGGTTLTIAGTASIIAGTSLRLGNLGFPSTWEVVKVAAVVNAGTITTTTATQFDHITGGTVSVIGTINATALSVNAGTT